MHIIAGQRRGAQLFAPKGMDTRPTQAKVKESLFNIIQLYVPDAQVLFPKVDGIVLLSALGETRKKQIKEAKRKVAPFAENYYGMIINKIPMDVYKQNVKDHDYYFVNKKGEQTFYKNQGYKKYSKTRKTDVTGEEAKNNEK